MSEFEPVIWYTPYHHKYRDLIATPYKFQLMLLYVLLGMHFYWTVFMVKVGMGIFKAGKYKNVYDNKENKLDDSSPTP